MTKKDFQKAVDLSGKILARIFGTCPLDQFSGNSEPYYVWPSCACVELGTDDACHNDSALCWEKALLDGSATRLLGEKNEQTGSKNSGS